MVRKTQSEEQSLPLEAAETTKTAKPKTPRKKATKSVANSDSIVTNTVQANVEATETSVSSSSAETMRNQALPTNPISIDTKITQEETPVIASGCGSALKQARINSGLSVQEVCKQLRLSSNQIEAIENDLFHALPHQSTVRGFIRNYAKLLKIDAEPVLRAYQNIVPDTQPKSLSVKASTDKTVIGAGEKKVSFKLLAILGSASILIGFIAFYYNSNIKPHTPTSVTEPLPTSSVDGGNQTGTLDLDIQSSSMNTSGDSTGITADSTNLPLGEGSASQTDTSLVPPLSNNSDVTATPNTNTPSAPIPSVPATPPAPATTNALAAPTPLPAVGESAIQFQVSAESWVRVETPFGKKIFSALLPAGTTQSVNAKPPVNIIVGNAEVTKVNINQQPYDLSTVSHGKVARIQLK